MQHDFLDAVEKFGWPETGASLIRVLVWATANRHSNLFYRLDGAPPTIGTPVNSLGQLGIRFAVLADSTTEPIAGLRYTP
jgi:hypothetical protein